MRRWEGYRMSRGQGNNVVKIYCVKKFYRKIRCYSDSTAFRDDLFVLPFSTSFLQSLYVIFIYIRFLRQGLTMHPWLAQHSLCRSGCPLSCRDLSSPPTHRDLPSYISKVLEFSVQATMLSVFFYTIRWIVYFQFCLMLCKSLLPRQTSFNFEKFSFIVLLRIFCPPLLWHSSPCYRSRFFHDIPQLSYVLFTPICKYTQTHIHITFAEWFDSLTSCSSQEISVFNMIHPAGKTFFLVFYVLFSFF